METNGITRRAFVSDVAKAAFGVAIVPRHVLGGPGYVPPSDKLNIAIIGAGGMGMSNAEALVSENIVALCDIDFNFVDSKLAERLRDLEKKPADERERLQKLQAAYTKAKRYADFRVMLERERKNIDAVVIATPDHVHAVAAAAAMKLGMHVYVQKPLTYSVYEARYLRDLARQNPKLVTQMGNQGHSMDDARRINEWIQAGVIGPVREVHVWTNRPIWPQGLPWPARTKASEGQWSQRNVSAAIANAMGGDYPVPEGLNWDLFLGPSPEIPYHPIYHPFNWRGWVPWGVGALGDMGAHLIDHPYWALGLTYPTSVEATSTPFGGPRDNPGTYPLAMIAHYEYPRRGLQPPVKLYWYDGGLMPPRPEALPDNVPLDRTGGVIFVGERGILMHETYGRNPRLFPESLAEEAAQVPQTYERIKVSHEMNWVEACKGKAKPTCPFEYAAPLTENMLLGLVALRAGQGVKIYYDAENMRITNVPEANQYLHREYRAGWSL